MRTLVVAGVALAAGTCRAQTSLVVLPGFQVNAVSGDGIVVVGKNAAGATRWTQAGGAQVFHAVAGAEAMATNGDGSVIAGAMMSGPTPLLGWRWSSQTGVQMLPQVPGAIWTVPLAMSTDGEVVIGYAGFPVPNIHYEVWRWTAAGGIQTLPLAGAPSRFPSGISGDGSRIVGRTMLCSGSIEPGCNPGWLWTAAGGYEALQPPPGVNASAGGISRDGVVVVGTIGPVPGAAWRPYRWESNTPTGDFGTSPSVGLAVAGSPSADGSVVVGSHNIAGQWYSWIWKENLGLWDLGAFLRSHGAPGFPGWSWPQPSDLSDDGRVVIGNGYMPGGNSAGWVAFIDGDCYADCNGSWHLTIADFACFQNRFVAGDPYADCNADTQLTVADFLCYQSQFVAGCP